MPAGVITMLVSDEIVDHEDAGVHAVLALLMAALAASGRGLAAILARRARRAAAA